MERLQRGGHYSSPAEVQKDLAVMFENAKLYNPPGHPIHEVANSAARRCNFLWSHQKINEEWAQAGVSLTYRYWCMLRHL